MHVQYVYNEAGERESVIIPYKEWMRIRKKINDDHVTEIKRKFDPTRFKGIYKNLDVDPEKEANALRDEWERSNI